ncbi:hypothetical protein [Asanoa iriomotensis]|uniref:FXSXX-COOH protein n=1 Tax=Asanoa iriomotensis TaxID=234613 RepID=A0ABQ4CDF0_9ACTN|nr:hypothetical protein [Asanoa iriomotensis]GIF60800.1 hypothetical protein Air01nite_68950 [Asanoa iriomotensis]
MPETTAPVSDLVDIPLGMYRSTRDTGRIHGAFETALARVAEQATSDDKSARFGSKAW